VTDAYLAFGANLGDRERNIATALCAIEAFATVEAVSSLYETDPVPPGQPPYLNAACRITTELPPAELLTRIKNVERAIGRRGGERWGPRPIDIDLLLYGEEVIDEAGLRVPHEGLAERAFVLAPLAEIAGDVTPPATAKKVRQLADETDRSGVRVYRESWWEERM
jgi:2-amino-4-hydroxy-6-hydroxymethyldihydropteridine diphosphokinase